jgi:hypothetical protein
MSVGNIRERPDGTRLFLADADSYVSPDARSGKIRTLLSFALFSCGLGTNNPKRPSGKSCDKKIEWIE